MYVTLGMIVLNEEEYLESNLRQHYDYADQIIIVEGADQLYPKERVSTNGLSTDRTAQIVQEFPDPDRKIKFIQHGWTSRSGDQAKCELRNRYMEMVKDGLLWVVDADEFYRQNELEQILREIRASRAKVKAWQYPQVHFWHTTEEFITGMYYDLPHTRFWRIQGSDRYVSNHNTPERLIHCRIAVHHRIVQGDVGSGEWIKAPCVYHFGFCKNPENMRDKNRYYLNRGERQTRPRTAKSRAAWFKASQDLHPRLAVHRYAGPLPEVFTLLQPAAETNLQVEVSEHEQGVELNERVEIVS